MRGGVTFATLHSEQSVVTRHTTSGSTAAHIHNDTATQPPLTSTTALRHNYCNSLSALQQGVLLGATSARAVKCRKEHAHVSLAPHNGSPEVDQLHTTGVRKSTCSTQRESGNRPAPHNEESGSRSAPHNGSPEIDQLHTTGVRKSTSSTQRGVRKSISSTQRGFRKPTSSTRSSMTWLKNSNYSPH